jgi:hypothetical protein
LRGAARTSHSVFPLKEVGARRLERAGRSCCCEPIRVARVNHGSRRISPGISARGGTLGTTENPNTSKTFDLLETTARGVRLRYCNCDSSLLWGRSFKSALPVVQSIEQCRRFGGTYRWLLSPCWVCDIESVPDAISLLIAVVGMLLGHERKTDREGAWADVLTGDLDSAVSHRTSDGLGCWTRRPA